MENYLCRCIKSAGSWRALLPSLISDNQRELQPSEKLQLNSFRYAIFHSFPWALTFPYLGDCRRLLGADTATATAIAAAAVVLLSSAIMCHHSQRPLTLPPKTHKETGDMGQRCSAAIEDCKLKENGRRAQLNGFFVASQSTA